MSGAGAGSNVGLSDLRLELLAQDTADLPQQWNDALRATMAQQVGALQAGRPGDVQPAPTASVPSAPAALVADAKAVVMPALPDPALPLPVVPQPLNLPASAQPSGVVSEEMAAAGPEQRPVALTDPTPSIDPMAPVVSLETSENVGPADPPSDFTASPALPEQLVSVLLAAGYRPGVANLPAGGRPAATSSDPRPFSAGPDSAAQIGAAAGRLTQGAIPWVPPAAAGIAPAETQTIAGFAFSFATTVPAGQALAEKNSLSSVATPLPSSGRSDATTSDPAPVSAGLGGTTQAGAVAGSSAQATIPPASAAVPAVATSPLNPQAIAGFTLSYATTVPVGQALAEKNSLSPVATPLPSSGRSGATTSDPAPVSAGLGGATQAGAVTGSSAQGTIPPASAAAVPAVATSPLDPQAVARSALSLATTAPAGQSVAQRSSVSGTATQLPSSRGSARSPTTLLSSGNQGRGLPAGIARAGAGTESSQEPVSRVVGPTGAASAERPPGASAQGAGGRTDVPTDSGPAVASPPVPSGTGAGSASPTEPHATGSALPMTGGPISATPSSAHHSASRYEPVIVIVPARDVVGAAQGPLGRRASRGAAGDSQVVSYAERRVVPTDVAPVSAQVVAWRLDDTQALAPVGRSNPAMAAARAAELYRALMDDGTGLAAIEPGEGFITWAGSPLWLSMAGIGKPAALGVLPAATPGRVQVIRTERGEWLVEHAGGLRPAPRALRHDANAGNHEALLLDVLYGVAGTTWDSSPPRRFECALAAMRFAGGAPQPTAWRAQEAWGMAARCCAAVGAQPGHGSAGSDRALEAALGAVVDGPALAIPSDPRAFPPLARDRCIAMLLSGDPNRIAAALGVLGRPALDQASQGRIDGIGPLDAVALAWCLGRLTTTTLTRFATRTDPSRRAGEVLARRSS